MQFIVDFVRPATKLAFQKLYRMRFFGVENVPLEGPLIITPNHVSYYDPILIHLPIARPIYYMAWDRLFEIPVLGSVISKLGAFPVKLAGHDLAAMRRATAVLKAGGALVIFPEGSRSHTGQLTEFKPGAFRLAVKLDVPVLPVAMKGAWEVWPPHKRLPKLRGKIDIYYGKPVCPMPGGSTKQRVERLSACVYQAVLEMLESARRHD
ncbi:MAG: lysophospholipid acyltransferase family protein [Acidobacteriota bacterium]|nr:1-acyl-sn-glycerol-3-phosphate acyltransferase [Blastocatellia bacterium]MDW8412941.1 lysophospholipid acyltransferase family protein [Acidobacteriota bacterium]